MSCPRCGCRSAPGIRRCPSCGTELEPAGAAGDPKAPARRDDSDPTRRMTMVPAASPAGPGPGGRSQEGTQPLASRVPEDLKLPCPGCSREVGADWRFCQHCGAPLHTSPQRPPERPGPAATRLRHVLKELDLDGLRVKRTHELAEGSSVVGRAEGDIRVPGDSAMSTRHASFEVKGARCVLRDLGSTNGSFVALTREEALEPGSVVLAGSQRLLLRSREDGAGQLGDELVQVLPLGHAGRRVAIDEAPVIIGKSARADFRFADDHYLSRNHCQVRRTGRGLVVDDLGSTNRTYLLVQEERALEDGDRLVLGEQLFEYRLEED